jgi:hypothetical protein
MKGDAAFILLAAAEKPEERLRAAIIRQERGVDVEEAVLG